MNIYVFDIETTTEKVRAYGRWKQNISQSQVMEGWKLMSWAGMWLDDNKTEYMGGDTASEKEMLAELWKRIDAADAVIGHNMRKFDLKKVYAKFVAYGFKPPSPAKVIDTLEIAKKHFAFQSNRLGDIAQVLGVEQKIGASCLQLETRIDAGEATAWEELEEYNRQDVIVTKDVYMALRPWSTSHPNANVYTESERPVCTCCGSENIHYRGYAYTNASKFRRFVCKDCGKWDRTNKNLLTKETKPVKHVSVIS